MEELINCYFLRLYKSGGNYLRLSRNSAFKCSFSKRILNNLSACSAIYLIGNPSLSKFVIVGLVDKPIIKVSGIYDVKSCIPPQVIFQMRMDFYKHDQFGKELIDIHHYHALCDNLLALNKTLFS